MRQGKRGEGMKHLELALTKIQIYKIREWVAKNGYPEGCGLKGKYFYLITQPIIKVFEQRLDVMLLTQKQGEKLKKIFQKMKLVKEVKL